MSSPPPPWGTPGPYIPPTVYGETPSFDGSSPARPRPTGRWPWLVGGGLVLVVLGVLAAVVLSGGGGAEPGATAGGPTATVTPTPAPLDPDPLEPSDPAPGRYPGSVDVAQRWLDALADGDAAAAFELSCPQVQASSAASAGGGDAAETLAAYFADRVLDGGSFTRALLGDVRYDPASGTDVVTFVLFTEEGPRPVEVFVIMEGTVCDFR